MFNRKNILLCLLLLCRVVNKEVLATQHEPRQQQDYDREKQRSLRTSDDDGKNQLTVLTLGGSVTWGATLPTNRLAYPYLIGQSSSNKNNNYEYDVHNLAIRASDAYFPSLCIESMSWEADVGNIEFDVIVLEFSINGFSGMTTLLKRLQYRYPDAVLIYVHLMSLRAVADRVVGEENDSWTWKTDKFIPLKPHPKITLLLEQVGAYIYTLPISADRPAREAECFYSLDGHHLSEKGHDQVANDILQLLNDFNSNNMRKSSSDTSLMAMPEHHKKFLHTWGEGDHCSDWFTTGKLTNARLKVTVAEGDMSVEPVRVHNQGKGVGNVALEFPPTGGVVMMVNDRPHPVTLYLSYMSGSDGMYPVEVRVAVNNHNTDTVFLDPHSGTVHHVRKTTMVGLAQPGENFITIEPRGDARAPFRLVGVALFGFQYNMGLPLRTFHNRLVENGDGTDTNSDNNTH